MRRVSPFLINLSVSAALMLGCDSSKPVTPSTELDGPRMARGATASGAASTLPALKGGHAEAYATDGAGTVIAGYSWDQAGNMRAAKWTLRNGSWAITVLPHAAAATGAVARAVNDQGDAAGNDWPGTAPHAVLWPVSGGFSILGCNDLGQVYGISAGARVSVGVTRGLSPGRAAVWTPGACREDLPPLAAGSAASARAVNGDGTIVGGSAAPNAGSTYSVPVRWTRMNGVWQIEQLDSRAGSVHGANSVGDLVGSVQVACGTEGGCSRAIIWYSVGGTRVLGTLGGDWSVARDINSAREVVGTSSLANGAGMPFMWSESRGLSALTVSNGGNAFAMSDVRADGSRLVVGAGGRPFGALLWVVRSP